MTKLSGRHDFQTRIASEADAVAIAAIYNQGIEDPEKHAKLQGRWLDVVIVERLIPANLL